MNTTTLNPATIVLNETPQTMTDATPAAPSAAPAWAAEASSGRGVTERGPELGVAGFLMLLGALVVFDSARLGAGWADDGPQSGYFPFYIGAMLLASSGFVFIKAAAGWLAARRAASGRTDTLAANTFVGRDELQLVLAMLVPATLYVVAMGFVGLYLSSIALIAWFMRRHGGFGWLSSMGVALGVPATVFLVFERWFLVPLPKGPVEALLGF